MGKEHGRRSAWASWPESFWLHPVDTIGYELIHVRRA
jgi:hypothetical protein